MRYAPVDVVPRRWPPPGGAWAVVGRRGGVQVDAGVAACGGTCISGDDFATVENQSFKEAWNSDKFQMARRMFTKRDGSPEAKALICYDCPETITREEYLTHMASGGARPDFRGRFTSNDGFNHFFSRKADGTKATDPAHVIPLEATASRTSRSDESS